MPCSADGDGDGDGADFVEDVTPSVNESLGSKDIITP